MKKFLKLIQSILSGSFFVRPEVRWFFPFVWLFVVVAICWIANTYSAFHIQHKIDKAQKELLTQQTILTEQEKEFAQSTQLSKLVEQLAKDSITIAHNATKKIVVNKNEGGHNE